MCTQVYCEGIGGRIGWCGVGGGGEERKYIRAEVQRQCTAGNTVGPKVELDRRKWVRHVSCDEVDTFATFFPPPKMARFGTVSPARCASDGSRRRGSGMYSYMQTNE